MTHFAVDILLYQMLPPDFLCQLCHSQHFGALLRQNFANPRCDVTRAVIGYQLSMLVVYHPFKL